MEKTAHFNNWLQRKGYGLDNDKEDSFKNFGESLSGPADLCSFSLSRPSANSCSVNLKLYNSEFEAETGGLF